jgi:Tat protein secretion system quality control protein TatD with DNase activity
MSEDPFELLELLEKQIMQHIHITSMQMSEDPFELLELLEKQIMQHIQITSMQMTQDPFEHLELLEKQIRCAAHPDQINVMTEDPFELLQLLENQVTHFSQLLKLYNILWNEHTWMVPNMIFLKTLRSI